MKLTKPQSLLIRIGRGLVIPHELLHIVGYRLVGRQCDYRWGDSRVKPVGPMSRHARLVGLLFPFAVFSSLTIIFGLLSTFAYANVLRGNSPLWFILWTGLTLVAGGYAGTAVGDLRRAYLLIFNKPWYSWTPFDLFFWPVIDWAKIRKEVHKTRNDDPQD